MGVVVMALASCFVFSMVYVAASRVRTMGGVHMISFDRDKENDARVAYFIEKQYDVYQALLIVCSMLVMCRYRCLWDGCVVCCINWSTIA